MARRGVCDIVSVAESYLYVREEEDEDELLYGDSEMNVTMPDSLKMSQDIVTDQETPSLSAVK